ncbi:RHS repeat protein [Paenibacillus sp. HB172176]|uniref:RHS repeat protein n=1 Tax=Paenibacillus sp. HB172176 TaxID=2493690 RepID=UPI00143C9366|nr:RHS repeat protein [Paenibacillus sp. HB172176]
MKKQLWHKIFVSSLLFLLVSSSVPVYPSSAQQVHAESLTSEEPQALNQSKQAKSTVQANLGNADYGTMSSLEVVPDYSYVKTKPDEAPFSVNAGQEVISTLSGSLSQSAVDLSLPGRNGLGFSLTRVYSSDDAQFNQMIVYGGSNDTSEPAAEKQFPIGKGWSWDISFLEINDDDIYLHLSGTGVFKIDDNNTLMGYPWDDLTFEPDTTVTVGGETSAYVLKSIYQVNQYFNDEGQLLQISDSYNNTVTFEYEDDSLYGSVLHAITDAIGNSISIAYSENEVTLTKGAQIVRYFKTKMNGKELLSQVIDPLGRATTYDYDLNDALFNLLGTTPTTSNPYALLTGVTYPTGAKSVYAYESTPITRYIDTNAVNQVYRVISRQDEWTNSDLSTTEVNHTDISYPTGDIGSAANADLTFTVKFENGHIATTFENEKDYISEDEPAVYYNNSLTAISTYNDETYTNDTEYTYDRARKWPVPITTTLKKSNSIITSVDTITTSALYNDYGNIVSTTDPAGIQTTSYYDPTSHLLVGVSKPLSATQTQYTEYVRDPVHGNVTTTRVREGSAQGAILQETINNAFDTYGNVTETKILRQPGTYTTVHIDYDPASPNLGAYPTETSTTVTDVENNSSTIVNHYTYNTFDGSLASYTDANNGTTSYEYDALGRVIKAIHPDTSFIQNKYFDYSNEIRQVDETGVTVYTKWNPIGWKTEEGYLKHDAHKPMTTYAFDLNGRLLSSEDVLNRVTGYDYDEWNRQFQITYPDLSTSTQIYDDINHTQTSTDAEGYRTKSYFDVLGRVLSQEETKPTGIGSGTETNTLISYTYDYAGNVLTATDYLDPQNTTAYSYDVLGQLATVTNAKNEVTHYDYDLLGNLTQINYPDSTLQQKTYDEIGRLIQATDATNRVERFYYDGNGNQVKLKDREGNRFKYTYNNRNFQTKKEIVDSNWNPIAGEETITFSYDDAGRRVQLNDVTGQTSYTYSADRGLLSQVTYPDAKSIQYDYDAAGNRSSMKNPFGGITYYHYDELNRLDAVAPSLDFTNDYDATYSYFDNNQLKEVKQRNGVISTYQYDGLRVKSLTEQKADQSEINTFAYTYDNNGNQKTKIENGITHSFTYDSLNRLATSTQFNETYDYDDRGNRSSMTTNHPFDSPGETYTYDKRDRLTSVTTDLGATVSYTYNGDGLLWERTENGEVTRYYWDGDQVVAEATVDNNVPTLKAKYIRGNGLVAREDDQGKAYYLLNGHGDVVELRDSTGNTKLNQYSYDVFGNIVSQYETIEQPFKYSGEMTDDTTELQYLRARWYDPSVGRFINKDTYEGELTNPLSLNLYTYVQNNPLIYNDPTGHWCTSADNKWEHPGTCNDPTSIYSDDMDHDGDHYKYNGYEPPPAIYYYPTEDRFVRWVAGDNDAYFTASDSIQQAMRTQLFKNATSDLGLDYFVNGLLFGASIASGIAELNLFRASGILLESGSLSSAAARAWYLEQELLITSRIDTTLSLEQQAFQAFKFRNQIRQQARDLMSDRTLAQSLAKTDPNLSWEQVVQKQISKGFKGDEIWKAIIQSAQRSRKSVNDKFGL